MFHLVEALAASQIWLGLCGMGLTIIPILGIIAVHSKKDNGAQFSGRMLVLGTRGHRFDPCRPDINLLMKMTQELQSFTVEEFQADFDSLLDRVENGESFIITSEHGNAVIVPYNEIVEIFEDAKVDDEVIRIHTDHEEGS